MKLTILILLLSLVQVSATVYSQVTRFNMKVENKTVLEVLQTIEETSDFRFFYQNEQVNVNRQVSVEIKELTVEQILDKIFAGQGVNYKVMEDNLILLGSEKDIRKTESQQQPAKTVTGKVTDTNRQPMPGVTVIVKGTTTGTITNADGNYSISNVPENAILLYSFVGMRTQEVAARDKTRIDVSLEEESIGIEEVVAIGYGTMKKSDLTGSISSVRINESEASSVISVDKLLQGRAAGVYVSSSNASPGGAVNVRIRGTASLSGSSEPLYVIDGVIVESSMEDVGNVMGRGRQGDNSRQEVQNSLTALNPQDIESIEVLKDASATAIYGSRGTNGVVIITTKSGKTEKSVINLNVITDFASMSKYKPMLPGQEYTAYINERNLARGSEIKYTGTEQLTFMNWQEELTRNALSQTYRLSASARKDKLTYYLAGGYTNNKGIVKSTGMGQYDFRLNSSYNITPKLKATTTINLLRRDNSMTTGTDDIGSTNSSLIRQMVLQPPLTDLDTGEESTSYSPKAWIDDYADESLESRTTSSLSLDYEISSVFTARLFGAYDSRYKQRSRWYGPTTYTGAGANGQVGKANLRAESINLEALLLFNKDFSDKHQLSGTVGVTYDQSNSERWQMVNENFFTYVLGIYGMGYGSQLYANSTTYSNQQLFSLLARLNYNYNEKYFATFTSRMDGSSKFSTENRFSYFPSVSLSWRINKEDFLMDNSWLSNLKLRAGWGQTGNQAINPFQTKNVYRNVLYTTAEGGTTVGMVPSLIANTDLVWEATSQTNVGLDVGFLKNRINLSVDAYYKKTSNLLQEIEAPLSAGFETITVNRGSILNKGIEFALETRPVQAGKFSWLLSANLSFNRNEIVKLGLTPGVFGSQEMIAFLGNNIASSADVQYPVNIFIEGKPIGLFWGYETDGIWQNDADAAKYTYVGNPSLAGDIKLVDQNGDFIIDASDKTIIGDPSPDFIYGLNSVFQYDRLSLNLYFYGTYGNEIFNANRLQEESTYTSNNVRKEAYQNAWRADKPSNEYPRLGTRLKEATDRQVEDGSFLRLGSASLEYNLPLKYKWISNVNLVLTGKNLLTLTSYKGFSPDVNSFAIDPMRVGLDWGGYPNARSWSVGLNITF